MPQWESKLGHEKYVGNQNCIDRIKNKNAAAQ
uniref:Uncharacterized protein n=1 Tax=Anguilla anguilla TaxID=7936 RepID=A0A0E9PHD7_ANGAN